MNFADKWLVCSSCRQQFLWDAGEQAWYHINQLKNEPRHCKQCRDERKKPARKFGVHWELP